MAFISAIKHNLSKLTEFTGRDRPGIFWPYAGSVLGLLLIVIVISISTGMGGVIEQIEAFAAENPDAVHIERSPGHYSATLAPGAGFTPDLSGIFLPMGGAGLFAITLLAAATTRRLHDRGLSGFIALVPVTLLMTGLAIFSTLFSQFTAGEPDLLLFFAGFANNIIYLLSIVLLLVQLAGSSTTKPTRHGPIPD
ncbi:DUF805 domain-containing protein [Maricaulis parjimensis]|uniref:DUF805 domain-containing protein n=1 Tax=Maricaulis parjimensis TaxID=144023 RepID=UPI00193A74EF|nr:DUF805 domain-containing protein [Maricaulis parjimensis]